MKNKTKEQAKKEIQIKKYKSIQIGLIAVLGMMIIGLSAFIVKGKIDERKTQNQIMDSFYEYFEKDELTLIYFTSSRCDYCAMETPILEQIAKDYKIDYLAVDHTKLTTNQKKEIMEKLDIEGLTPTTVIVKSGEIVAVQIGYIDGPKYVEFLIKAGMLAEDAIYTPEKNLTFIDYDKFENLRGESNPVTVVIGSSACPYCLEAKPILSNLSKAYDIPIYYLTIDYMSVEERTKLVQDLKDMEYKEEVFVREQKLTTPAVLVVQEGKVAAYVSGLQNVTVYTKLFKDNGVIEE
jgi:Thiol-disulfide isomerase and thioredoxins